MGAKLERLGAELAKARKKKAEWDSRVKDLERRYREEENSEIHEMVHAANLTPDQLSELLKIVPFPVSWTVKMKKKQKETQDILSYHSQAAGCSDKARAKASGGRQPIEECGRTGL